MMKILYKNKPYVLLDKTENMVLNAGTLKEMNDLKDTDYYGDCRVLIRKNDLHLQDNTRVNNAVRYVKQ